MRRPLALLVLLSACGSSAPSPASPPPAEPPASTVEQLYLREAERRDVAFTRLAERRFARAVTAEEIAAYRGANETDLRALFEHNRQRWTDLEPQVRARHILVRARGGEPPQAARVRAEELRRRLLQGASFATLAAAESEDPGSAARGGDLGYFPRGRMVPAFDEAAFGIAEGVISEVIESRFGFHILQVTGHREGTLSFEDVVPELAERGARNRARHDAMLAAGAELVRRVRAGETLMAAAEALFPERPTRVVTRSVYLGVPWPFRPALRDHVAHAEPVAERWIESVEGDRELVVFVVTRRAPDPGGLTPEVAQCLRARAANDACEETFAEGPCDACVPAVHRALREVGDPAPRRSPVPLRVVQRPIALP